MDSKKLVSVVLGLLIPVSYYLGYQSGSAKIEQGGQTVAAQSKPATAKVNYLDNEADYEANIRKSSLNEKNLLEKIAQLQFQYDLLKDKSKRDALDDEERRNLPHLFKQTLNEIPMDVIVPRLEKYANIDALTLSTMSDQRQFVSRLAEVAMQGIITEEDADQETLLGPIMFSRSPGVDAATMSEFSTTTKTIFAKFSTVAFNDATVFAKWYRVEDGQVLLFRQLPINQQDSNFIWVKNDKGFERGLYKVDVFQMNEQMELLSSGLYEVR